jgi:hypothetical protein
MEILAEMCGQLGSRWALLVDTEVVHVGIGRMFRVFSEIKGLNVGLFTDKDEALAWLREEL